MPDSSSGRKQRDWKWMKWVLKVLSLTGLWKKVRAFSFSLLDDSIFILRWIEGAKLQQLWVVPEIVPHDAYRYANVSMEESEMFDRETIITWFHATRRKIKSVGVSLKGRISRLPERPFWVYGLIALQKYSPLLRRYHPTGNWLRAQDNCWIVFFLVLVDFYTADKSVIPVISTLKHQLISGSGGS